MITLMQRPQGMTLDEACKEFDWQHHTVRGAIAGALKGKLGLKIDVEDAEGGRGLPDRRLALPSLNTLSMIVVRQGEERHWPTNSASSPPSSSSTSSAMRG